MNRRLEDGSIDKEFTVSVLIDRHGKVLREIWRQNGVAERVGGPALTTYDSDTGNIKSQFWEHNGEFSRLDGGPAVIHFDTVTGQVSRKEYWVAGKKHRDNDQPAHIEYGSKSKVKRLEYYKNGQCHRDNGPAV
ncbi:hypothetical protein, partial [Nisaea nitritireducens]|uniref:hypothetical protein n=1 Tax=Nisaea nitritireducens TaxID=568392 RepID=UPI001D013A61